MRMFPCECLTSPEATALDEMGAPEGAPMSASIAMPVGIAASLWLVTYCWLVVDHGKCLLRWRDNAQLARDRFYPVGAAGNL